MAAFAILFLILVLRNVCATDDLPYPRIIILGATGISNCISSLANISLKESFFFALPVYLISVCQIQLTLNTNSLVRRENLKLYKKKPGELWPNKGNKVLFQALASPAWEMFCLVGHMTLWMRKTLMATNALSKGEGLTPRRKTPALRREGLKKRHLRWM